MARLISVNVGEPRDVVATAVAAGRNSSTLLSTAG